MPTIRVQVTKDHIERGKRYSCMLCPVALALGEVTGETWVVQPTVCRSLTGWVNCLLPVGATNRIQRFDAGEPMEPFTFRLTIPEE